MNIDFVVMGHESRVEEMKKHLIPKLGETWCCIDDETSGVWVCAREAWNTIDKQSDYGVVIQDDAILCDNFREKVEAFLTEHDGHVVSFYFGDTPENQHWIQPDYFDAPLFHAVCLAIPTHLIDDMIAYCDKRPEVYGDDMKIKRWLIANNRTCRYSNPSLVQHRTDIPSIIDPSKPPRQSAIYEQSRYGYFECDSCHVMYEKAWPDVEAVAESFSLFPEEHKNEEPMGMVCDACFYAAIDNTHDNPQEPSEPLCEIWRPGDHADRTVGPYIMNEPIREALDRELDEILEDQGTADDPD